MEITSTTNNLIKEIAKLAQKKYRKETGLFIIEGQKAADEARKLNIEFTNVFVLKDKIQKYSQYASAISVTPAVMKKISTTETEPEIIAVAKQLEYSVNDIQNKNKIVLLENIKDSGNLGTIIRTCTALKADAIILTGETADIYNPKTVRAAVGNLFKIPFINLKSAKEAKNLLKNHILYATVVNDKKAEDIKNLKPADKFVIMFGSEADGLTQESENLADVKITIPLSKDVESLNLSTAVTICVWEILKHV